MVELLDAYGRPLPKTMFEAVRQARRLRNWTPGDQHINTLLQSGAPILRNRSRQMTRDNGYAANACESFCANLIGTGIKPSVITEEGSGISEALRKALQRSLTLLR
jgi:capsid protein